ncbi:MAG: DUF1284 domain-containing protein [Archaeoglobaceae archaeon]
MRKLRGHHLICLHFFKGYGYDEKFVENVQRILKEIKEVEVVDGIDEICMACPHNEGFCNFSENSEMEVKELDSLALKLMNLKPGMILEWEDLKVKVPKIMDEWRNLACRECDWRGVCDA